MNQRHLRNVIIIGHGCRFLSVRAVLAEEYSGFARSGPEEYGFGYGGTWRLSSDSHAFVSRNRRGFLSLDRRPGPLLDALEFLNSALGREA
ncbi:hypothetical protein [Streptomyces sp. NPDC058751]|uniref:hypothetical protein n=1 Tax=Streptomyces sp. NPDC058751 TaxID=3346623 RepID=UPI00367F5E5D